MQYDLIATATFGLEAVVKREIQNLGYHIIKTEDGKITYRGDERAIVRSNLHLRSADRVLLKMAEFDADTFEELFQQVKGIEWEGLIPPDGKFTVVGTCVKSQLHSVPACQSICKKAIVERLGDAYCMTQFPETGAEYTVKFAILKDRVTISVDSSGAGLHKRGYRVEQVQAPIKETLAAAMVQLSFWNPDKVLIDPCCGSGTVAIEAAMIGRNIAPGLNREFACSHWDLISPDIWKEEKKAAYEQIDYDHPIRIIASDIDPKAVHAAEENAMEAGVDDVIQFSCRDIKDVKAQGDYGVVIMNPPYGERIGEKKQIERIYQSVNRFVQDNPTWSIFMITSDKEAEEKAGGRLADRRRKLYNGRIEVCYYQFHGKRPEKRK